jgi:oligopeptidase B
MELMVLHLSVSVFELVDSDCFIVTFEVQRLVLLNRGFILAFAHVRGGSEKGSEWHLQGMGTNKMNSFLDLFSCAQFLIDQRYTNDQSICIKGVSAGAMLAAGGIAMRPDLFRACVVKVPFLDVLTIMLDSQLPLTEHERDEWGDPVRDKHVLDYIKLYSPYEQLLLRDTNWNRHSFLFSASWDDFRAPFWNVVKFVARLRQVSKERGQDPLVLLRIRSEGHYDDTAGIEAQATDIALEYSFMIFNLTKSVV